jgi:hypothetical protein
MDCPWGYGPNCPVCRLEQRTPLWTRYCLGVREMERAKRRRTPRP